MKKYAKNEKLGVGIPQIGMGRFGDADSATPVRRRRFGDGQFGDRTIRRQDSSAMGPFGANFTGLFGDRNFVFYVLVGRFGDRTFRR